MRRSFCPSPALLVISLFATCAFTPGPSPIALQSLTLQEVSDAQAAGVGCSWSPLGERGMRFAAADDHAVVKVDGRVVKLKPAKDATDMFPFTYDAWSNGAVRLTVAKASDGHGSGGVVVTRTMLMVEANGRKGSIMGDMECGD